jgi:hypothetical protein
MPESSNSHHNVAGQENSDIDLDFEDNLKEELSPLHQICPKPGQTLRIAMLDSICKPKATYYHWYRSGFYRCNTRKDGPEALCCAHVQRSWTCVSLALVYLNTDALGKLSKGADITFRVGYVSLAKTAFSQVAEYHKDAPGCDLYYTKDGGYRIEGASRIPRWKESPQAAEVEIAAGTWVDGIKLTEKLGKKLTDDEWGQLIKTGSITEMEDWGDD